MGCLIGKAAEVVAGVPLTDGAYDGAWGDLMMRYDNPRVLLCAHMRHLISCPAAVKSSATEIKRLLGVLNQTRRAQGEGDSKGRNQPENPAAADATILNASVTPPAALERKTVLLATARVLLEGPSERRLTVRALLDSEAAVSFVTERVAQFLRVDRRRVNVPVSGLQGKHMADATTAARLVIRFPTDVTFRLKTEAFVLRRLANLMPPERLVTQPWRHLEGLPLADPDYATPATVDVILDANIYGKVKRPAVRCGEPGSPEAHLTAFGWVLTGEMAIEETVPVATCAVTVLLTQPADELSATLRRLWELEEVAAKRVPTPDEDRAEEHFQKTHFRDATGRYVVRLPCNLDRFGQLSESHSAALSMLLGSDRRLARKPELKKRYTDFMVE
ncbi:uncharacterized protein LOC114940670 [Nylanderia fulva]|uniref:uncharacterized protein LOC114940670 n=1 Tax=Nylanderia fulva TaxID=613905 RepID=UPI0010FBBC7C|nr:uncharacterized protein LOC114940670 [Nylanderia fulva]